MTRRFDTLGWLLFLFPMLIFVRAAGCKSVTIDLPVISELRDYWLRRTLPALALLTTSTSIAIGGFVLIGSGELQIVAAVTALTGAVLAIASYFYWMLMWEKGVRVSSISDRWVRLNNVHPAFAEAVDVLREEREARRRPGEEEDDAECEAKWRRRRRRRERDTEPPPSGRPLASQSPPE